MKFQTCSDVQIFLLEIGSKDISKYSNSDFDPKEFTPTDEDMGLFVKRRNSLLPGIKNFRKSQLAKAQWRSDRYKMMKGIKKFHSSTAGKTFHRKLGNFLATRDFLFSDKKKTSYSMKQEEAFTSNQVVETLRAISSAKTYLLIPYEFYMTLDETVDYMLFTEEALPTLNRIEESLYKNLPTSEEDLEFLLRLVETNRAIYTISQKYNLDCSQLDSQFGSTDPNSEEMFLPRFKKLFPENS